jgi:hypothetical protein
LTLITILQHKVLPFYLYIFMVYQKPTPIVCLKIKVQLLSQHTAKQTFTQNNAIQGPQHYAKNFSRTRLMWKMLIT